MQEFIQYAGQVIIDSIVLYSADRKTKLDISFLFSELNLFEDIYSPTMHGSVMLIEGFNLPSSFPLLGEEMLEFKCHTPTFDTYITKNFAVVGISDKMMTNNKTQAYSINFISIESLVDMNLRVSRAFAGTPSEAVTQIFKTYFPAAKLRIEACSNALKIVSPTISPFNLVNLFATKAVGMGGFNEPNFLFFEDNQNYNFISLAGLYSQAPRMTFRWSQSQLRQRDDSGESTRDIQAEYENVKEINIDSVLNTIEKTMSGSLGHKVFEVDIVRKTINKKTYSYVDNFATTTHLNNYPTNSANLVHSPNAVIETCIVHPAHHNNFQQDRDADILVKRPSILAQDQFIKMDVVAHGRTDMKVGDIVNFEMLVAATNDAKDQSTETKIDPYYSGKYIIAAMQHRFTLNRHEVIMQLAKDSFNEQIDFSRTT